MITKAFINQFKLLSTKIGNNYKLSNLIKTHIISSTLLYYI